MKRDDMNVDEILKHHLPRAHEEDLEAELEAIRKRLLELRFQVEPDSVAEAKKAPDAGWMHDYHVGVLMAVDELQGYGHPVSITLKAEEILEEKVMWGTAVFLILRLMERMDLVSSSPIDPEKPTELDRRYFAITQLGRETLAEALAIRQRKAEGAQSPLKGFAR
jgi:hypothetical protein